MSSTDPFEPRATRDWLDRFEREPDRVFDRLIRGIELPEPYGRADPVDALAVLFENREGDDPLLHLLDATLDGWLTARRADPLEVRRDHGPERYVREVGDAFSIVHRLNKTPITAKRLRDEFFPISAWVAPLALNTARDAAGEFWRALAETQIDQRLRRRWYRLCDEAGLDKRWENRLRLGLIGLRRMPGRSADVSIELVVGLALWARRLRAHDKNRFLRRWRALVALYPRRPAYWAELAGPVLEDKRFEGSLFIDWWREDLRRFGGDRARARRRDLPPKKPVDDVAAMIAAGKPIVDVRIAVERVVKSHQAYAEETGDGHYLVRTACNLGGGILNAAPDLSQRLAWKAIEWEPNNPFGWTLWARALDALGRHDSAELVFWETRRRFPDDAVCRNDLANLLARLGRVEEAEALFRDTARRFPKGEVCRNHLANLLARLGRAEEAEALFRDTARRFPKDEVCRGDLAVTLIEAGRFDDAVPLIDELRRLSPDNANRVAAGLARARRGEVPFPGRTARANGVPPRTGGATDPAAETVADDGRAARADFRLSGALAPLAAETRTALTDEANRDIDDILNRRPDHAGAIVVDAFRRGGARGTTGALSGGLGPRLAVVGLGAVVETDDAREWSPVFEIARLLADPTPDIARLTTVVADWRATPDGDRTIDVAQKGLSGILGDEPTPEIVSERIERLREWARDTALMAAELETPLFWDAA